MSAAKTRFKQFQVACNFAKFKYIVAMDNQLRLLERAAAYGDTEALTRLSAYKLRIGMPDYGTVPKQIWDFYHLPENTVGDEYKQLTLKLACKLARTKPCSELHIACPFFSEKALAVALASDTRFPVLAISSRTGILGFEMKDDLDNYENIFPGRTSVDDYDGKTPIENKAYTCNIARARARNFKNLEVPLRTTLVVCEPLNLSTPIGKPRISFTLDDKMPKRSAAASWQEAIKALVEKTIANYGRVWYIRSVR